MAAFGGQRLITTIRENQQGLTQAGAASKFIVQEPEVSPDWGTYAFGAVLVYESSGKYPYFQGDVVEIGGMCDEYFGQTEMIPHNAEAVNLVHPMSVLAVEVYRGPGEIPGEYLGFGARCGVILIWTRRGDLSGG